MRELEMKMRNLMSSVFETVTTVQDGVRVLDSFRPFLIYEVTLTDGSFSDTPNKHSGHFPLVWFPVCPHIFFFSCDLFHPGFQQLLTGESRTSAQHL